MATGIMGMVQCAQLSFAESLDFWRDCRPALGDDDDGMARRLRHVMAVIADDQGVSPDRVRNPKGRFEQRLRLASIYLTAVKYNHSMCKISHVLGLSKPFGSYVGRVIEDRRDDAAFDAWLDMIERRLGDGF